MAVGAGVAARLRPRAARTPTRACSTGWRPTSGWSTRRTPPATGKQLAWMLAETWKIGIVDWPDGGRRAEAAAEDRGADRDLRSTRRHRTWRARSRRSGSSRRTRCPSIDREVALRRRAARGRGRLQPRRERPRHPPRPAGRRVRRPGDADARRASTSACTSTAAPSRPSTWMRCTRDSALARLSELLPGVHAQPQLPRRRRRPRRARQPPLLRRRRSTPCRGPAPTSGTAAWRSHYVTGGQGMPDSDTGAVESRRRRGGQGGRARARPRDRAAARIPHGHHRERAARGARQPGGAVGVLEALASSPTSSSATAPSRSPS